MVMWMKATAMMLAASSAPQVGGMLSTCPRNRVGVCFPAAAVFSPFGLLYQPTTRGLLRSLRRLILELSAMRRPMAVKYCLCVQRSKGRSKFSMCQSLRHQKTLKLLRRDGTGFKLQARRVHLSAEVARRVVAPIVVDEDDQVELTRTYM